MTRRFPRLQKFLGELKRRHVTQVLIAYSVVAFAVMQVADTFFPALRFPAWTITLVAALVIAGLPVCACFAWAFDLTPEGVQPTDEHVTPPMRARRLAVLSIVVVAAGTLGGFAVTRVSTAGESVNALAVLPFENMSDDRSNEHFADGITEDVLTQLSKISGVKVISRTSVMRYKDARKPIPEIANELQVGAVLEGSVRRDGGRVRIVAQLIEAKSDKHLWAETYDRDIEDIFVVQSEIARKIADALRVQLTPEKKAQLERVAQRSVDPRAYDLYLRAITLSGAALRDSSTRLLERAIEIQPNYAPAYAAIARNLYYQTFLALRSPRETMPLIREYSVKALKIDDELADAHGTLALYHLHYSYDWAGAEREFKRALELAPADAQVRHDYSHLLVSQGRSAESAAETVRASELSPNAPMLQACVGWHRFADGHYSAAIDGATKALMMSPNMFWPRVILGWGHEHSGNLDVAIAELRKASEHAKERPFVRAALAHALAKAGQRAEAEAILRSLTDGTAKGYVSPYDVAVIYAGLGDRERAAAWLEKAYDEHATFTAFMTWDPRLAVVRDEPRVEALVARLSKRMDLAGR